MDDKTMVRRVCEEAALDEAAARDAISATLGVLAQRIYGDEARHLADQLPVEFKEALAGAGTESQVGRRPGSAPDQLGFAVPRRTTPADA